MLDRLRKRLASGIKFLGDAGRRAHARARDVVKRAKMLGGQVRSAAGRADKWLESQGELGRVAKRAIAAAAQKQLGDSGISAKDLFERGERAVQRADKILNRSEEEMVRLARKSVRRLADRTAPRLAQYLGV